MLGPSGAWELLAKRIEKKVDGYFHMRSSTVGITGLCHFPLSWDWGYSGLTSRKKPGFPISWMEIYPVLGSLLVWGKGFLEAPSWEEIRGLRKKEYANGEKMRKREQTKRRRS